MRTALFQTSLPNGVRCNICPKQCVIAEGHYGFCHGRKNEKGTLIAENYGRITSIALDPIEKKPLRHFSPGSTILSVGTYGCNFRCDFCQNWTISQGNATETAYYELSPEELVRGALLKKEERNIGIAFTYNEPTVWYEYVLDTAKLAKENDLKIVLVTNGYIQEEPLKELLPFVDGMNIDLKAFHPEFYEKVCFGDIDSVKKTIQLASEACHVEISTLLIPELNDGLSEISRLAEFLSDIDPEMPLHLSRYFPRYKRKTPPPTSIDQMEKCRHEALKFLTHVYLGNV